MSEKIFYSEHFYEKAPKDTEALEKNVRDYPFSSLANFLLLYHYKKIGHPDFEKQAKKTALLFNNPDWLEFQLNNFAIDESRSFSGELNADEKVQSLGHADDFPDNVPGYNTEEMLTGREDLVSPAKEFSQISQNEVIPAEALQNDFVAGNAVENAEMSDISQQVEIHDGISVTEKPATNEEIPAFEPLHTIDYFASQGIRLSDDQIKNDKLVNQVKSFTAWLKTMKKLHPVKLEEQAATDENLIQTSAETSNVDAEVLTEAMAEVLIKQNKTEKAIEMYHKLSLINPAKSAYFASRIEQIKSTL